MERFYIRISGLVQGVGFRAFVSQLASHYSMTGWVRNLDNGDVDMEIQGTSETVEPFILRLRKGNHLTQITDIKVQPLEVIQESSFKIVKSF